MYWAHSAPPHGGNLQPLADHLTTVRDLAADFAKPLGYEEEAALAGLLHDCGKYGDAFQLRLAGLASQVDHWTAGAYLAYKQRALAASVAIHGHHIGLKALHESFLQALIDQIERNVLVQGRPTLSGPLETIQDRFARDGLQIPTVAHPVITQRPNQANSMETMLLVRFIASCLMDADFLDTEAHFQQDES
ncbi:MAG: CRISPR-associated endonuclease Cas3'', partial [Acidithiobacillus sp.]|nr:CRISPR-associated endonuclease Cas3'' [Acidithiobacillus sp.]